MHTWLVIAAVAATLTACAQAPVVGAVEPPTDEGILIAASLGYHVPAVQPAGKVAD